jgi:hypothetical protein
MDEKDDKIPFGSFAEFWAALTRLFEAQLASDTRLDRLASMVTTLAGTVTQLATVVESHERRLGRMEGQ